VSQKSIRALIEQRLATWAATKSLPVAWQNVAFTPPAGTYLRAFLLPAETDSPDLQGVMRTYAGVYQVSIALPEGQGSGAGETLAGEIDALFPLDLRLNDGAVTVQMISPASIGPAIQDGSRYTLPVSFRYRCDTV